MRKMAVIAAMCAAFATPVAAQQDSEQSYKALGDHASRPVATVHYGPAAEQVGDLRLPHGRGPFPVVIFIHGGCWRADVDSYGSAGGIADALTARGFAVWNVEYRRIGNAGGGWPGTFQDISAAVDKVADLAPRYHLDPKRVVIAGHSAGAHLALWAASRTRLSSPWNQVRVHPAAVVAIDGPGTLAPLVGVDVQACGRPVIVPLMGGTPAEHPAEYAIASPADHLPLGVRQLIVPADFTPFMQPYIAAARASGDAVEVLAPPNANHFDVVTPTTSNGAAVIDFIVSRALPTTPARPKPSR